ncbi:hypothetical protein ATANTOWER_031406, partial [Ataeniobius toweri]|nr:hypothetical protein [Ataeniobius toweri]
ETRELVCQAPLVFQDPQDLPDPVFYHMDQMPLALALRIRILILFTSGVHQVHRGLQDHVGH